MKGLFYLGWKERCKKRCRLLGILLCTLASIPLTLQATGSNITGIWANEGEDKVTQDELRATTRQENLTGHVINRAWNGQVITLVGGSNEIISFNLVLEAGGANSAQNVSVQFDTLTGPNGVEIKSMPATGMGVFQWVNRPIELFYARYVQIKGLSYFGYGKWDERAIPVRFQRPYTGAGNGQGYWTDRPDHDKFYPDALVPLELINNQFTIAAQQNQSIWSDIYIPKNTPAGLYEGTVAVSENGTATHHIPVQVIVSNFALPDTPSAKTMVNLDPIEISKRFIAGWGGYANWQSPQGIRATQITARYYEMFHRHKLSTIGEYECPIMDNPCDSSMQWLSGELFTPNHGYDGPGVGVGTGIYSIGAYGIWGWPQYQIPMWRYDQNLFNQHIDAWASWFASNLPNTDYHLYLEDEPPSQDYSTVNTWAQWIKADPGPGHNIKSLVTHSFVSAQTDMPDVDIPIMPGGVGNCPNFAATCDSPTVQQQAADYYRTTPQHELWIYNDSRPGVGTAETEDDGIAMRTKAWAGYKKQIKRWFYWFADLDSPIDWYAQAVTWGSNQYYDPVIGETGYDNTSNGNGLLVYPGSSVYPNHTNYGVDGPVASLRMKSWRRGIQDVDYLTLAAQYDSAAVTAIVNQTVPYVLWEYPTNSPGFYTGGGPSWSSDPDVWESARAQLARIISIHCASASAATEVNSPCTTPPTASSPISIVRTEPTPPSAPTPVQPVSAPIPAPVSAPIPAPVLSGSTASGSSDSSHTGATPLTFVPVSSCRVLDTRLLANAPFLAANQTRTVPVTGGNCSIPASAKAFDLNLTVVPRGSLPYLTIWPTGMKQPLISSLNSYDGRIKANGVIVPAGTNGSVNVFAMGDTDVILDVNGYFTDATTDTADLVFYPVTPCRVVDTRLPAAELGGPFLSAKSQRTFSILQSSCGLPSTAQAYSFNYTAIPYSGLLFMTAWATGQNMPSGSILNAPTNAVTANGAITKAGTDGSITMYVQDDTDMIIDVNGYFGPPGPGGMSYYTIEPCRDFDSRATENPNPLRGFMSINFTTSGCGIPSSASVLTLNATVVPSAKLEYLTLWPAGQNQPFVSTLNAYDGQVTSNFAIVPATKGSIASYLTDESHLVFDVFGYFQ